jgi:hypothetical protein
VFNASAEPVSRPLLVARTGRGERAREARWTLEATIGPGEGARTSGAVQLWGDAGQSGDDAVQVVAERAEAAAL